MEWTDLLNAERLCAKEHKEEAHRPFYVQDADRIVFSPPFRRLANKTQVHPLYDIDHLHHRLIHSVETSSVGRSIGIAVGYWLEEQGHVEKGHKHIIAGVVQAACLAHDIGNPPFGHSGEDAISQWFRYKFHEPKGLFSELIDKFPKCRGEFENFEGNAQGFRILTRLEINKNDGGMQLSNAVIGAFTKYPTSEFLKSKITEKYCGKKKFGIFETESKIFTDVAQDLKLKQETLKVDGVKLHWWRRHPLVFLVEAADDICYSILDIEDGFISGDISFETAIDCLAPLTGASRNGASSMKKHEQIAALRASGIGSSIDACVKAFEENYACIMNGTYSGSLVESSEKSAQFDKIKNVSETQIYTSKRKTELEVSARNVLHRVLDGLIPVYQALMESGWKSEKLDSYNRQVLLALKIDTKDIENSLQALHSLTDFVSGMTDRYAVKTAKMLTGM